MESFSTPFPRLLLPSPLLSALSLSRSIQSPISWQRSPWRRFPWLPHPPLPPPAPKSRNQRPEPWSSDPPPPHCRRPPYRCGTSRRPEAVAAAAPLSVLGWCRCPLSRSPRRHSTSRPRFSRRRLPLPATSSTLLKVEGICSTCCGRIQGDQTDWGDRMGISGPCTSTEFEGFTCSGKVRHCGQDWCEERFSFF